MIIEGPYDPNAPIAQNIAVVVVKNYETNTAIRRMTDAVFARLATIRLCGFLLAEEKEMISANLDRLLSHVEFKEFAKPEVVPFSKIRQLETDQKYAAARGFQADPSCSVYRDLSSIDADAMWRVNLELAYKRLEKTDTYFPWRNPSSP